MPFLGTRGAASARGFGFAGLLLATGSINSIGVGWNASTGTFTYSTVNATSATINGVSVPVGTNRTYTVGAPGEGNTAYYTLVVQPGGASYTGSIYHAVRNPPALIQFAATSAFGTQINIFESMTVSWNVSNSNNTQIYYPGAPGNTWQGVSDAGSITVTADFINLFPFVELRAYAPDGSSANFGRVTAQTAYVSIDNNAPNPAALNTSYTFTPTFVNVSGGTCGVLGQGSGDVSGATGAFTRKFQGGGAISGGQYTMQAFGTGYRGVPLQYGAQKSVANGWTGNITT